MRAPEHDPVSRRQFLHSTVAAGAAVGLAGPAAADDGDDGGGGERTERRVVGTATAAAADRVRRRAERVVREIDFGDRGRVVVGEFPVAEVDIESDPEVRYVESDADVRVLGERVDTSTVEVDLEDQLVPWGVERVGADVVHERGETGAGADVAIVDTGIDSDHPDLRANLGEGYAVVQNPAGRRPWDDDHDHGTHCAGIAGAAANDRGVVGVAPDVTLHAVKVISADGGGSASSIAEGLRWVADRGYDVASLSLGSTSASSVIHDAVRYATDAGVLVVGAAGNEEPDEDSVHYPGAFPEAICVGATAESDDMADFSLTGDAVELSAPGAGIPSTTIGDYARFSGTSMATPHVSGAAGLLATVGLSADAVRERLSATADDLDHDEEEQGNGLLDVDGALEGVGGGGGDGEFGAVTRSPTGISRTAATLNGALAGLGGADAATVGFRYWVAGDREATETTVEVGSRSAAGGFEAPIEGLTSDTTYAAVAYAVAGGEEVTGRPTEFATAPAPTDGFAVETGPVEDVDEDEAELVGRVTEIDVPEVVAGFEFRPAGDGQDGAGEWRRTDTDEVDETGPFSEDAEDLDPGTTYEYVAYGTAGDVELRGGKREFTTAGGDGGGGEPTLSVETGAAADVDEESAELAGRVVEFGGMEAATVFCEFRPADDAGGGTWIRTEVDDVDEPEGFAEDAEGLWPGTTYAYRAVAVGGGIETRGEERTFTTAGGDEDGNGGGGEPTLSVETGAAADVDEDEAELVGRVVEFDGAEEATVSFEFWPAADRGAVRRTDSDEVDEADGFDEDAEDLSPETTYGYVATARAAGVEVRGEVRTFTTAADD